MKEKDVRFTFKARYFKLGEITPATSQVWFVLHGYGQLAQYFLKKFSYLEQQNICVIAPEALSKFYIEPLEAGGRKNNRVGATWMTRENRLTDIENYVQFLNSVYEQELAGTELPTTVLGFSQGAATASRWAVSGKANIKRLVLWAGVFPPDMDVVAGSQALQSKDVWLVYGKNDTFLSNDRFEEMQTVTTKLNTRVNELTFDGGHDIDEAALRDLFLRMENRKSY